MSACDTHAHAPFDDIRKLVADLPQADAAAGEQVRARDATLVKPPGALGRLEEIAVWLAQWTGRAPPRVTRPLVAVFASDHGIAERGVSAWPQAVTRQMMDTMAAGGAAVSILAREAGAGLKVYDLAVGHPTPDIATADAMDERACVATMAFGMEVIAEGTDLLAVGEVGIANTAVAAALACALFGGTAQDWVGPGAGTSPGQTARKIEAVDMAVARHRALPQADDPLVALARVGGRELAAMAGAILAARLQRVPVVLDGYISLAAAAVLFRMNPHALDHCLAGHASAEPGARRLLDLLGLTPVLDLSMALGEGSGAALAVQVVKTAAALHADMATFAEAGVG